ncbi:MAG TPA: hypothetical protein VHY21_17005 [Pseudonocardiaceae bacterium]|nr:hypothetical protein [Pseudonocardiaceae bacterium]
MLVLPYLLLSFLAALVIVQRVFREFPVVVRLIGAFVVSITLTGWVTFGAGWLIHDLGRSDATFYGAFVAMGVNSVIIGLGWREFRRDAFRAPPLATLGVGAALALSGWLMLQRLSGDPLMVSLNTWGDTALHIGIARSFSEGDNYPPVLPIFSGETIHYHFGFDFYAGALERMGLPIEWAFNLPGALGFTAIIALVFELAYYLWQRVSIGIMAAVLFATNGSLAFLRYFAKYPSVIEALKPQNWWNHDKYLAGAPYQSGERISIFWTLNPYLTQTHLIVSMALVLFVGYALLRHLRGPGGIAGDLVDAQADDNRRQPLPKERATVLGVLSGTAFWLNGIVFVASMVFFCVLYYLYSGHLRRVAMPSVVLVFASVSLFVAGAFEQSDGIRKVALLLLIGGLVLLGPVRESLPFFIAAGVLALPQIIWLNGGLGTKNSLTFHNGYLVENFRFQNPASYLDFVSYWWLNLGLAGPLVILAAVVGRRADHKLLVAVMAIFVFGNIVVLGTDVGGHDHKVFNLWKVLINLFAAYSLVCTARALWRGLPLRSRRRGTLTGRGIAVAVIPATCLFLVLSGLLDFMTVKNDPRYAVFGDAQPAISWIEHHTSRNSVFLTAYGDVYTIPTLAGRPVYLGGFSYWAESMGYDNVSREHRIASIYDAPDQAAVCTRLRGTGIAYIQVSDGETRADRFPQRNPHLFPGGFVRVYSDAHVSYYDVGKSCRTSTVTATNGP